MTRRYTQNEDAKRSSGRARFLSAVLVMAAARIWPRSQLGEITKWEDRLQPSSAPTFRKDWSCTPRAVR